MTHQSPLCCFIIAAGRLGLSADVAESSELAHRSIEVHHCIDTTYRLWEQCIISRYSAASYRYVASSKATMRHISQGCIEARRVAPSRGTPGLIAGRRGVGGRSCGGDAGSGASYVEMSQRLRTLRQSWRYRRSYRPAVLLWPPRHLLAARLCYSCRGKERRYADRPGATRGHREALGARMA